MKVITKPVNPTSAACHFICGANKSPSRSGGCWQALWVIYEIHPDTPHSNV